MSATLGPGPIRIQIYDDVSREWFLATTADNKASADLKLHLYGRSGYQVRIHPRDLATYDEAVPS